MNIDLGVDSFKAKPIPSSTKSMNQMTSSQAGASSTQQTKPNYNVNMSGLTTSMGSMSMGTGATMGMRPPAMGAPMGYQYGGGVSGGMGMGGGMSGGMGMGGGMSGGMGMGSGMSGGMGSGVPSGMGYGGYGGGMPYMTPGGYVQNPQFMGGPGMRPS